MIDALKADILLQTAMVFLAVVFGISMAWRFGGIRNFLMYFLQGMTLLGAIVILISMLSPAMFESVVNEKAVIVMVSMMTLIYAIRDAYETVARSRRESAESQHRKSVN